MYYGLFHSHLNYSLQLWGHAPYSKRLFLRQKTRKESCQSLNIKKRDDHCRLIFCIWPAYDHVQTAANMYTTAWYVSRLSRGNSIKKTLENFDKKKKELHEHNSRNKDSDVLFLLVEQNYCGQLFHNSSQDDV